jgi:excisionase family DNA binding protein
VKGWGRFDRGDSILRVWDRLLPIGRAQTVTQAIEKVNRYLSLNEAAEYSTLSVQTLRRKLRERKLKAYRPSGRRVLIDVQDLDQWIHSAVIGERTA